MNYKTPGVYVEEISLLPPSVAAVETAIPAFIGYTEKASFEGENLSNKAIRITSLVEYEQRYGTAKIETYSTVALSTDSAGNVVIPNIPHPSGFKYRMYYSLRMFFANGGGPCYIISVGSYSNPIKLDDPNEGLLKGLSVLALEDEPTLIVFPDAVAEPDHAKFYDLYEQALAQCGDLQDRFAIIDVHKGYEDISSAPASTFDVINNANGLRDQLTSENLKYGAAYYPWIETTLTYPYLENSIVITGTGIVQNNGITLLQYDLSDLGTLPNPPVTDADENNDNTVSLDEKRVYYEKRSLFHSNNDLYHRIKAKIENNKVTLPPSSFIAGVYARVDNSRGVWKAPANVSITGVNKLTVTIDDDMNDGLNVDPIAGKSVNAIRKFTGKGNLVWGARTLAGNDNEWRYVPVRRFFNMVEESVKKATIQFVFEPNDANTWTKVKAMIENFLINQWRNGALTGNKPEQAFFVSVGLGETMTAQDILEGKMIVEIGMAVVRPAEFIILRFSHKMQEA